MRYSSSFAPQRAEGAKQAKGPVSGSLHRTCTLRAPHTVYFCLKHVYYLPASPVKPFVESGRDTRRVALLHATQAAELDKVGRCSCFLFFSAVRTG